MLLRQGMAPVLAGTAAGLGLVVIVGNVLRAYLFDVGTVELFGVSACTVLVIALAAVASYLPAHRASEIHPMEALRAE